MKTVVENNAGLDRNLSPERIEYHSGKELRQGRSCFYDFGAESSVEFSGFVEEGDSEFIRSVGKMLDNQSF